MINDIYNSSISTYYYIPHSNYDISEWNFAMYMAIFGLIYGRFLGLLLVSLYEDYKQLKAHKWNS